MHNYHLKEFRESTWIHKTVRKQLKYLLCTRRNCRSKKAISSLIQEFHTFVDAKSKFPTNTILKWEVPFPVPVNTNTNGQIPDGNPCVAISSPTEIIAALAAANEGYIYEAPRERKGVEYPRFR